MKRIALTLAVALLLPNIATAERIGGRSESSGFSEASGFSMLVPVLVGSVVISASAITVQSVVDASAKANTVRLKVATDTGKVETIDLPKQIAAKADLKAGDKLAVKPSASGAMLLKNEVPVAYLVSPENSKLSKSHELAR